ncbi:MAG: peptidoglycan bridge formation glycyltransferase FemA/FemB family protein [Anaerolineae bacterium]
MFTVTSPSPKAWDAFVAGQPRAHVLQQSAWGELKAAYGWGVDRVALADGDSMVAGAQLLFRRCPSGMSTMAYLPMGGYATTPDQ